MYTKYLPLVQTSLAADPPSAMVHKQLAEWIGSVADWNRRVDLTAARNDRELVDLMLADAAMLATRISPDRAIVDVGTGAGAPGLALAALRPDLRVTLVEPMQKRAALLRITAGGWRAKHIEVVQARGEQLVAERRSFEVAVSRATLAPPRWLELGAQLAPSGEVWVLLAREETPVLAGWEAVDEIAYRWPLSLVDRRAVRFARGDEVKLAPR